MRALVGLVAFAVLAAGCGGDEPCTVGSVDGCSDGLICEDLAGVATCTEPVFIDGMVFDMLDSAGLAEARVVARDANGGARSDVAFTDAAGDYSLRISVARDAEGRPTSEEITLRVDASGYASFPAPPREALPIDLTTATLESGRWTIANAATDVGLIPRNDASGARIEGIVQHAEPGAVLVVAEQGGVAVATSITGFDGSFVLYDVPPGETTVTGYRAGLSAGPVTVESIPEGVRDVVLVGTDAGLATVSGSVNIVNAPGGLATSVILVIASTLDDVAVRGETPAGLRAGDVSSSFSIEGVPPGRYAVLAAFENDRLVRDPDEGIAGTAVVFIDVAGSTVDIAESFKVTEALEVISPGADGLEVVTSVPQLSWAQDSSEDGYELRVYDALGELVLEDLTIGPGSGSSPITYDLAGRAELTPGMIYQLRAWSHARGSLLSGTEDLKGVFQYSP